MTRHLPRPGLSRRGLLKGASALGASSLLLPFGMQAAMAQPRNGGVLRVALGHGSTADSYDPAGWTNDFAAFFATSRHGYLTEIGPDGQLIGEIAEQWQTADAVTWVLKIRAGVSFHSGKALTVDDVIASLNHHRTGGSAVGPLVDNIVGLRADGRNLIVTLAQGNVDFPFLLSDYHLPVLPCHAGRLDITSADGCGPYREVTYQPGVAATLDRNPAYWKSGRAHFDGIEIVTEFDSAARQDALISGAVDLIDGVDLSRVMDLKRAPGFRVLATAGTRHLGLAMDSRADPYRDPNLRLALKYAIDREQLVTEVLHGYGHIGNDHPIGPTNRYFNTDLAQKSYDPDRARYHLALAGFDRIDLTVTTAQAAFDRAADLGALFAKSAAQTGINLSMKAAPDDTYWAQVWRKQPFCATASSGRATEDWVFSTGYASGARWNDGYWEDARFDALLRMARSELADDKRREMYWEMQAICADQGAVVTPMFASYVMAHGDRLQHDEVVGANWALDGFRAAERWWFA